MFGIGDKTSRGRKWVRKMYLFYHILDQVRHLEGVSRIVGTKSTSPLQL